MSKLFLVLSMSASAEDFNLVGESCACKDLVNNKGYGNCLIEWPANKGLGCYIIKENSNCSDAKPSITTGLEDELWSNEACEKRPDGKSPENPGSERPVLRSQNNYAQNGDVCMQPRMRRSIIRCRSAIESIRFFFDGESCVSFAYGGCGASQNHFTSLEECKDRCPGISENDTSKIECVVNKDCGDKAYCDNSICRGLR